MLGTQVRGKAQASEKLTSNPPKLFWQCATGGGGGILNVLSLIKCFPLDVLFIVLGTACSSTDPFCEAVLFWMLLIYSKSPSIKNQHVTNSILGLSDWTLCHPEHWRLYLEPPVISCLEHGLKLWTPLILRRHTCGICSQMHNIRHIFTRLPERR